ncbi:MAG: hypothetical protein WCK89_06470, partial [bacterium]
MLHIGMLSDDFQHIKNEKNRTRACTPTHQAVAPANHLKLGIPFALVANRSSSELLHQLHDTTWMQ